MDRIEERRTADGGSIGIRVDITDLKRSEASFRLLFEENPLPMWVADANSGQLLAVTHRDVLPLRLSARRTARDVGARPQRRRRRSRRSLDGRCRNPSSTRRPAATSSKS
jgi:hypothetical protein